MPLITDHTAEKTMLVKKNGYFYSSRLVAVQTAAYSQ